MAVPHIFSRGCRNIVDIADAKKKLRVRAMERRRGAHEAAGQEAGDKLARNVIATGIIGQTDVVSGFWSMGDEIETKAIKTLFGEHAYDLSISSIKSMIGHAMGAAGALEAIASILTIYHGLIPPTINYEFPDPECDLDYTVNQSRSKEVEVAISNSFGLGGQNACLVFKKFHP